MKPIDYRNATWKEVRQSVVKSRESALAAYRQHGPGTTREIAQKSGIDLLTLRPRTTELFQLGFIELIGGQKEGVYRARTDDEAREFFEAERVRLFGNEHQTELQLA